MRREGVESFTRSKREVPKLQKESSCNLRKGDYLGVKSWLSMLDNELIPITVPKDDQVITIKDGSDDDPDLSENRFNNNARDASSLKKQAGLIIAAYNEIVSLLRCLKIHVPKLLNSSKIFGTGQSRML